MPEDSESESGRAAEADSVLVGTPIWKAVVAPVTAQMLESKLENQHLPLAREVNSVEAWQQHAGATALNRLRLQSKSEGIPTPLARLSLRQLKATVTRQCLYRLHPNYSHGLRYSPGHALLATVQVRALAASAYDKKSFMARIAMVAKYLFTKSHIYMN